MVFNATVSACAACICWRQALSLLELTRRHHAPNLITYTAASSACTKEMKWREALELMKQQEKEEPQTDINKTEQNGRVYALCHSNKHEHGIACYHFPLGQCDWCLSMKSLPKDLPPTVITYGGAISALEEATQWQLALQLLVKLKSWIVRRPVPGQTLQRCEMGVGNVTEVESRGLTGSNPSA